MNLNSENNVFPQFYSIDDSGIKEFDIKNLEDTAICDDFIGNKKKMNADLSNIFLNDNREKDNSSFDELSSTDNISTTDVSSKQIIP